MAVLGFYFTNGLSNFNILVMSRTSVLILYNLLLPVFFIVAFPAWLVKMWRRGGYGTGLLERFAWYSPPSEVEPKEVVYVHAVSVGEVLIALKLIEAWLVQFPDQRFLLAATTSTGHEVARRQSPSTVRVIYSPLDFSWMVRAMFRRFEPQQIVLIESENWPNLSNEARRRKVPVSMVNARLSQRSESRYHRFLGLVKPLFDMVGCYCVQNDQDAERFKNLGVPAEKICVTGSIKFDPVGGVGPKKRDEFQQMLDGFGSGRSVVMAASTHGGEELLIGEAIQKSGVDVLYVVVPRHAERRAEVASSLESLGMEVILRSDYHQPQSPGEACLVVDSTGELRDWTAHADVLVVGKSWLGKGGQNPAEAIVAGVPVICGPDMSNFEPLISMLRDAAAIRMLDSAELLSETLFELFTHSTAAETMATQAKEVLDSHANAVDKTIQRLKI